MPRARKATDGAFDPIGKVMAVLDFWLIPIGWMFGLMFVGLGVIALPAFVEGGDAGLLALGVALLGLGRAAAAATSARRHRCRCGEREPEEGEEGAQ
ncbi:MAG: hypothetical protein ACREKH_01970 [Candidatus Rokuibacteriota bacterium]